MRISRGRVLSRRKEGKRGRTLPSIGWLERLTGRGPRSRRWTDKPTVATLYVAGLAMYIAVMGAIIATAFLRSAFQRAAR